MQKFLSPVSEMNLTRNMSNDPNKKVQLSGADLINYFFLDRADRTKNVVFYKTVVHNSKNPERHKEGQETVRRDGKWKIRPLDTLSTHSFLSRSFTAKSYNQNKISYCFVSWFHEHMLHRIVANKNTV